MKTYIFLDWVSPEFSGEHVENLFAHPSSFGERREGEVVRVHFPQTCIDKNREMSLMIFKN